MKVPIFVFICITSWTITCAQETSCAGRCGAFGSDGSCSCDDQCSKFGNCCLDYIGTCALEESCQGRCDERFNGDVNCHCDSDCGENGNCCSDYSDLCVASSCVGRCGEYGSGDACSCDDKCSKYGNCCPDFIGTCAQGDLCEHRCEAAYDNSLPCSCSASCPTYGDCCRDFVGACVSEDSCQGRCDELYNDDVTCHCDPDCLLNINCCSDYSDMCVVDVSGYYCNGECDKESDICSCKPECVDNNNCCPDYSTTCQNEKAWHEEECATQLECPTGYDKNTVILFSIDGFKAEYIHRNITPNIWKLASCGVHAPYQRSVFPTVTFPNHYTIVTGLYPESHGIVDNTMYDRVEEEEFNLGSETSFHSFWWIGEPMWITAQKQGKKSACYFWPGSDVDLDPTDNSTGRPDYWELYDGDVPFEERMYGALRWLDLPADERPAFITLYIENVDHAGHTDGPDSDEVNKQLKIADQTVGYLMEGLKVRGLENCVNIIILADHGMAPISCDRKSAVEDYGVNPNQTYIRGGAFGRVGKSTDQSEWDYYNVTKINENLSCKHDETHWKSYIKSEYLPKRFHYAKSERIEDVILTVDDTWLVEGARGSYSSCDGGTHGFDNEFKSMHALFTAHGPQFKRALNSTLPHENIEIYNLMADILQIEPAPNNGTRGSMNYMLTNPNSIDSLPESPTPSECLYKGDGDVDDMGCPSCDKSYNSRLDLSADKITEYENKHMLNGQPNVNEAADYCLLSHQDYINAYDKSRKIPYYVTYTLENKHRSLTSVGPCAHPDPRLPTSQLTSCSDYDANVTIEWMTLYPEELSEGDARYDAKISTNFVPVYSVSVAVWKYLREKFSYWSQVYNGVHVVSGPVFDYDFDGHADTDEQIEKYLNNDKTSAPIPSHYFFIIKRCKDHENKQIDECRNVEDIDVISYIIPNFSTMQCSQVDMKSTDWVSGTIIEHVARVRDVELITGMSFMTSSGRNDASESTKLARLRLSLELPQFDADWFVEPAVEPTTEPPAVKTTVQSPTTDSIITTEDSIITTEDPIITTEDSIITTEGSATVNSMSKFTVILVATITSLWCALSL